MFYTNILLSTKWPISFKLGTHVGLRGLRGPDTLESAWSVFFRRIDHDPYRRAETDQGSSATE
jgi:hypothetical protein